MTLTHEQRIDILSAKGIHPRGIARPHWIVGGVLHFRCKGPCETGCCIRWPSTLAVPQPLTRARLKIAAGPLTPNCRKRLADKPE